MEYKDSERVYWQVESRQVGQPYLLPDGMWTDHEVTIVTTENPETSIKLHLPCQESTSPTAAQVAHALADLTTKLTVMLVEKRAYPIS